jgi:hypothetical protein
MGHIFLFQAVQGVTKNNAQFLRARVNRVRQGGPYEISDEAKMPGLIFHFALYSLLFPPGMGHIFLFQAVQGVTKNNTKFFP